MALPTMIKAALPAVPGVNLLPGVAKKGGPLPDLTETRAGVRIDPGHVAAYRRVCGFEGRDTLPLTYLHMLSFPLQMTVMTDAAFPYPAIGSVHVFNTIHQIRPVRASEQVDVTVRADNLRPHPRGRTFDLLTEVSGDGQPVWASTSTYLRLGEGDEDAPRAHEPLEVVPGTGAEWRLRSDLGRRYAAVSGDHNPIHLYPLTARALGFRRQIAHGMWSLARSVAAFDNRLPDEVRVDAEFKKPIFLPGRVAFGSRLVAGGIDFSLTRPRDGAPHLVGRAR